MADSRKYYEAYDDRYRQVHGKNLRWFAEEASPIVSEVITGFGILPAMKCLEIGCGEGRDARHLLNLGFDLLATDISPAAISFCKKENPKHSDRFLVLDCIKDRLAAKFDFIYAVAVIHMLVLDEDRSGFYGFIRDQLAPDGIALICSMGDGTMERKSEISNAFSLQEREHEPTGERIPVASTSYRAVSFETFDRELAENGFEILKQGITNIEPDYWKVMYAVVRCKR